MVNSQQMKKNQISFDDFAMGKFSEWKQVKGKNFGMV